MVVSTGLLLAITRKRRLFHSTETAGLVSGSGYGTICTTTSVMCAARLFANLPASFKAASVASTDVNTTLILSRGLVSLVAGAGIRNFSKTGCIRAATIQRRL